jgi:hypothetical protein
MPSLTSYSRIPEIPSLTDILALAKDDLESSRSLQQRLLATGDALLATAITLSSAFLGLAFTNHSRDLALVAVPLILVLAYLDGVNWVHFRRTSTRVRSLERLFGSYVSVLRETGPARPTAIEFLRSRVDSYKFGIERSLEPCSLKQLWKANHSRARWWLFPAMLVVLLVAGTLWVGTAAAKPSTCKPATTSLPGSSPSPS